jgi:hypothetical protein
MGISKNEMTGGTYGIGLTSYAAINPQVDPVQTYQEYIEVKDASGVEIVSSIGPDGTWFAAAFCAVRTPGYSRGVIASVSGFGNLQIALDALDSAIRKASYDPDNLQACLLRDLWISPKLEERLYEG